MKFSFIATTLVALTAITAVSGQSASTNCTLTGIYNSSSSSLATCSAILISSLTVPPGVVLDLTNIKDGASITFTGTTTFGTHLWDGPLVSLSGNALTVGGSGTLDGNGSWYWSQDQSTITRPVFFRLYRVINSTLSNFTLLNAPYRQFSIGNSAHTLLTRLTLNSSAGDGKAHNTDGFDLSGNDHITISNNRIYNQDDCLAMQSSTNTIFSDNQCTGGHGISVGSIGGAGAAADSTDTVSGLQVSNNRIINSANGLRIKAVIGLQGLVTNVTYTNNVLINVDTAIVIRSDYNRSRGGYAGTPTSAVIITAITIDGLSGTATTLYDVLVNHTAVSDWDLSGITVTAVKKGNCTGQPSDVTCDWPIQQNGARKLSSWWFVILWLGMCLFHFTVI